MPKPLARRALAVGAIVGAASALWWRKHPSACPYSQRFWVEAPHPFITRQRLLAALQPQAGQRILEVGPGTGYYSVTVAQELHPDGRLDAFDIQQEMLDHTLRSAHAAGLANVAATRGDAQKLPFEDSTFDAAYLVTVLGEIPDQDAAMRELRRVLKPGGRLVVGELFGDPHWVRPSTLASRARQAGFEAGPRIGRWYGYFAVLLRRSDEGDLSRLRP